MSTSELLRGDHSVAEFDCGEPELDDWLKTSAHNAQRSGTARTFVWPDDSGAVLAYFAVAPTAVQLATLPRAISRGSPDPVPGYLIAKLARDVRLRKGGHGEILLADALDAVVCAATIAGGRVVVVDAINAAASEFYQRYGFRELSPGSDRLALKMSTAAATLGQPWPPA